MARVVRAKYAGHEPFANTFPCSFRPNHFCNEHDLYHVAGVATNFFLSTKIIGVANCEVSIFFRPDAMEVVCTKIVWGTSPDCRHNAGNKLQFDENY